MEFENYKIIKNFLSVDEANPIIDWVGSIDHTSIPGYHHTLEVAKQLKGNSHMFDISNTELTKKVTKIQSGDDLMIGNPPEIILSLIDKISYTMNIPTDNVFVQVVDMNKGGKIKAHYDVGVNGYIVYKCNISVLSEPYQFNVDKSVIDVEQGDLYCFEASLYKHWTEKEFNSRRVLLSFGFVLPYEILGRSNDDPRVRLSQRIEKYIQ